MFQLPQFVWTLRSSVWDVFINFLLIDATDRSKISSDEKRFFIALSLYPLSFFANTPFKLKEPSVYIEIKLSGFNSSQFSLFSTIVCLVCICMLAIIITSIKIALVDSATYPHIFGTLSAVTSLRPTRINSGRVLFQYS